jgi:hypothetical protein
LLSLFLSLLVIASWILSMSRIPQTSNGRLPIYIHACPNIFRTRTHEHALANTHTHTHTHTHTRTHINTHTHTPNTHGSLVKPYSQLKCPYSATYPISYSTSRFYLLKLKTSIISKIISKRMNLTTYQGYNMSSNVHKAEVCGALVLRLGLSKTLERWIPFVCHTMHAFRTIKYGSITLFLLPHTLTSRSTTHSKTQGSASYLSLPLWGPLIIIAHD